MGRPKKYKPIPPRILRGKLPPESFTLGQKGYRLKKVLKQDFFAATGLYVDTAGGPHGPQKVVLKHYHTEPWLGIPLEWAGRGMCEREVKHYQMLQGIDGIPELVGRVGKSAFVHRWVEGIDLLNFAEQVPDDFFDRLHALVQALHNRGMAYVDMNKPDNVLVGPGGQPFLIDFQISISPNVERGLLKGVKCRVLKAMQREDLYHVFKLKRKFRRDLMTPQEFKMSYRKSRLIRLHRLIAEPYRAVRRRLLDHLGAR